MSAIRMMAVFARRVGMTPQAFHDHWRYPHGRSEEHTSELQSLMRISYAVFCLKKKTTRLHPATRLHLCRRPLSSALERNLTPLTSSPYTYNRFAISF